MSEKGCLQHLLAIYFDRPACFRNIPLDYICVYVSFNRIILSLQIFCGVSACCNAALSSTLCLQNSPDPSIILDDCYLTESFCACDLLHAFCLIISEFDKYEPIRIEIIAN